MPLRALIAGQEILAPLLTNTQWDELKAKKSLLTLPCCNSLAVLRTSKLGTKHFVHKRIVPECDWKPETWQHLKAKSEIVIGCRNAGYDVSTEVSGDGWRADVLATKGNAKIAFEVQWSRQTLQETAERQSKYKNSGIRGCWLFRKLPVNDWHEPQKDLPMFHLSVNETNADVTLESKTYSLVEFIEALLSRKIRFCTHIQAKQTQPIRLTFLDDYCWKCKKPYHIYQMNELKTDCGHEINANTSWNDDKIYFLPQILEKVREFTKTEKGKNVRLATIKKRYSKTVQSSYLSFGCPYCDAIYGDWFLIERFMEAYNDPVPPNILETEIKLNNAFQEPHAHWCFPENGEFCCSG